MILYSYNLPYEKVGKNEPICIADEVPFEIPDSWEWCYLGDVAFVTKLAGFEYTKYIAPNLTNTGIPLFKGKNVQNGKLVLHFEGYIPEQISDELSRSQITKKCLLTPYVGTIGNIAIFDGSFKAHLGSNVGKIELINPVGSTYISEEYVLSFLKSPSGYQQLTKHKKATAQESISIDAIRNVIIPIPPLSEQHRIVEKIFESEVKLAEYANKEFSLNALQKNFPDALKKSILLEAVQGKLVPQDPNDEPASVLLERIRAEKEALIKTGKIKKDKNESVIFRRDNSHYEKRGSEEVCIDEELPFEIPTSWAWCRLSSIVSILGDGIHGTPCYTPNGEIAFINGNNLYDGKIVIKDDTKTVSATEAQKHHRDLCSNTVLVSINGTIGNIAFYNNEKVILGKSACYFNLLSGIQKEFIKLLLETEYFLKYAKKVATGTTIKNVPLAGMRDFLVPMPPQEEQIRISKCYEIIKTQITKFSL